MPLPTAQRRVTLGGTADAIKQHIIDAGLRPGDLMPTEAELCEALGVSRSSVREAIRTLGSLDIVEVRHGHGTYVGQMSLAPLVNGMVFRLSLHRDDTLRSLRDVVQTRIALDLAMTADLLAVHGGTHDHDLHDLVEGMRRHTLAGRPFLEEDRSFHARLSADVHNQIVGQLAGAFWEIHMRALPLLGVSRPQDVMDTVEAHGAILRAVEAGDAQAYHEAVLAHYAPLQRAIERAAQDRAPQIAPAGEGLAGNAGNATG